MKELIPKFDELEESEEYVAYIDVLGYKDKVRNSDNLKDVALLNFIFNKNQIDSINDLTTFILADCMYIVGEDLDKILKLIACIAIQLLGASKMEITNQERMKVNEINLIRGGITKGKVIVEKTLNTLLGPAVNEAYSFESKLAIYPRIIVSDSLKKHKLSSYFNEDFDGIMFFDFLRYLKEKKLYTMNQEIKEGYIDFMRRYKDNSQDLKIVQKYNWFINYLCSFQSSCDKSFL